MELIKKLSKIQRELKAPKNQRNNFGNYNYRSCEDILEAVKPLLDETTTLTIQDEIVLIGTRYYVKAVAELISGVEKISGVAYARESEIKKGMDESQITGAASSYARKYALNGLFLIDDTKDADTMDNNHPKISSQPIKQTKPIPAIQLLKNKAFNAGAKTEPEAIKMIISKTGVEIKTLSEINNDKAKQLIELWAN